MHNPEFLRNVVANEIAWIDPIPWNSVIDDQNDANLGAVIGDNENEEVLLVRVI